MLTYKQGASAAFAAFLLAFSLAYPLTVRSTAFDEAATIANDAARDDSPAVTTHGANGADSSAPDAAAVAKNEIEPRRKGGNGFVRAITAPFRAIARIFGGGKKNKRESSTAEAAVKVGGDAGTNENATRVAANNRDAKKKREKAAKKSESAARVVVESTSAAKESAQPVAANSASETARQPSEAFAPVVEGVPPDSLSQGRALLESGRLNEAIAQLSIAATVGPDLLEANNLLGQAYDRRGWHTLAQQCYERALEAAPKDPRTLANLGYSLYLSDNYALALKRLKQAARIAPFDARITANIAQVHFRLGNYDDAFKNFARISNNFEARVKLARLFEGTSRPTEAIKQYERALKLQPDAPAVLESLAALYQQTGRTREAEATRRTLRNPPNKQKTTTGGGG